MDQFSDHPGGNTTGYPAGQSFATQPNRTTIITGCSASGTSLNVAVGGLNIFFPFDVVNYGTFTFDYSSVVFNEPNIPTDLTFYPTGEQIVASFDSVNFGGPLKMSTALPPLNPNSFPDSGSRFNIFQQGNNAAPADILETVGSVCLSLLSPSSYSRPDNLRLVLFDENGTQLVDTNVDVPLQDQTIWRQVIVSWDSDIAFTKVQIAVDRQLILDVNTGAPGDLSDLAPTLWQMHAPFNQSIDVAYFYYGVSDTFYDLTIQSNLDQFITSSLTATNFGARGSNIQNITAGIVHSGNYTSIFAAENFVNYQFQYNAVTGLLWGGTLAQSPTQPPTGV